MNYMAGGQFNMRLPFGKNIKPFASLAGDYAFTKTGSPALWSLALNAGLVFPYARIGFVQLSLYGAGGVFAGLVAGSDFYAVPGVQAGHIFDFYFSNRWCVSFSLAGTYAMDKDLPGIFAQTYLGVGYGL